MADFECPRCRARFSVAAVVPGQVLKCPSCGQECAVPLAGVSPAPQQAPQQLPTSGYAIAALVLGIIATPGCWAMGIGGLVCGILAIHFARKAVEAVRIGAAAPSSLGMANAGRTCGMIGVSLGGVTLAFVVIIYSFYGFVFSQIFCCGRWH